MSAYALTDIPFLLQLSEYTGVYGVSFFIYLINYCILYSFVSQNNVLAKRLIPLIIVGALFLVLNFASYISVDTSNSRSVKVGIVQPNIDPFLKWDRNFRDLSIDRLFSGTYKSILSEADHIVWPETAYAVSLEAITIYDWQTSISC